MSWQSHCGKNYVLIILLYCNGSHQGISISSSPRQAIFGNVISRFSVFVFFVGLAYMQVFQVLPPLSYPENFPGYFTDLPISSLEIFLGISYISKALFSAISLLSIENVKYIVTLPARSST